MFSRNIKSTLRNLYNDNFINFVDRFIPREGPLSETGFKIYSNFIQSENFIKGKQDLYLKIRNSKKISVKLSNIKTLGYPLVFNDHLLYSDFLLEIFNSKVINDIKSYLGEGFKLDHTYLSIFNTSNGQFKDRISSGLFHHDSVGHRVKMFIPINTEGTIKNPTIYLEGTNKTKWNKFDNSEKNLLRNRIKEKEINLYTDKEKNLGLKFNDILIFDTNGIHKGDYLPTNENRAIIQFEFSNHKTYLKGQVGPGSFYLSDSFFKKLSDLNLLRLNRVKVESDLFFHLGKKNRNQIKKLSDNL